ARLPDFMNGTEWWEFRQDAEITDYLLQNETDYDATIGGIAKSKLLAKRVANHIYTNWTDYMLRTATRNNQYVSIGGVSNNNNTKTAIHTHIADKWSVGIIVNLAFENNDLGNNHAIRTGYRMSPLVAPYDSLGNLLFKPAKYAGISFTSSVNPLEDIKHTVNNE